MKKLLFLFAFASILYSCDFSSTPDTKEETPDIELINEDDIVENDTRSTTNNPLYNDLMMPASDGVFRGVNFDMSKSQVNKIETVRSTVSIYSDENNEELIVTTDMGKEIMNFADITYSFDEMGLYNIKVETYAISASEAKEVFDMIIEYYTTIYGEPNVAEDGFTEFTAHEDKHDYDYQIAIKNIDDVEDSYGMYMYFSLL